MKTSFTTFALLAALTSFSSAATIVSWGPANDIISTSTLVLGNNGETTLLLDSYASPSSENYYPNDTGKTPDFYASAFRVIDVDDEPTNANLSNFRIVDGTPDRIILDSRQPADVSSVSHGIFFWTMDEFLSGNNELESLSLSSQTNSGQVQAQAYFVIRLGTDYYRSNNHWNGSIASPVDTTWHTYNPLSDISDISGSAVTLTDFTNLTGVGVYLTGTGNQNNFTYLSSFEATAIPEPSTLMLVGLAFVGALAMTRRRS